MTEEVTDIDKKRQRGPNKIDVLEMEVQRLRKIIIEMGHYTGTNKTLIDGGIPHKDLYMPNRKDMSKYR